jgi:hypothetical protein
MSQKVSSRTFARLLDDGGDGQAAILNSDNPILSMLVRVALWFPVLMIVALVLYTYFTFVVLFCLQQVLAPLDTLTHWNIAVVTCIDINDNALGW